MAKEDQEFKHFPGFLQSIWFCSSGNSCILTEASGIQVHNEHREESSWPRSDHMWQWD